MLKQNETGGPSNEKRALRGICELCSEMQDAAYPRSLIRAFIVHWFIL